MVGSAVVGSAVVDDPAGSSRTGIDVVVLAAQEAGVIAEPVAAKGSDWDTYRRHASA
ncbi:hypothetical protein AB0D71_41835 [Streptomyces avermitilis]|uniref:hypothetical protein n=1 Tax=Streptomyces avermitilis TaxID=33903 RepID=UPI0033D04063